MDFYGIIDFDKYTSDFKDQGYPRWLLNMVGSNDANEESNLMHRFLNANVYDFSEDKLREISASRHLDESWNRPDFKAYISHGDIDITVPYRQSERLRDAFVKKIGEENVTFRLEKGRKHADDRFYTHESLEPVREFLKSFYGR